MALNFIILISSFIENKTLITMEEQIIDYLFLKTTTDDIILLFIGILVAMIKKWGEDNGKFEKKVNDSRELSSSEFKLKYKKKASHYKNTKWKWKLWWNENDQKILPSIGIAILLILTLPYGWDKYIEPNFDIFTNTSYSPFISGIIGGLCLLIMKFFKKKEREYLN